MRQYVVDAFTDKVFHGNQAAVCVLDKWLPEELMMNITRENNFSETAFTVKEGEKWRLRWFTPGGEIDLCGHATLGTAFVLLNYYEKDAEKVVFTTMSGDLIVKRRGDLYEMEFPAYDLKRVDVTVAMEDALGVKVKEAYLARDLLCVVDDEQTVRELVPDLEKIKQIKIASVVSDSVRHHRRQPTSLPLPWDSPGKNTGVGCHFLLQCMKVKSEVAQSCPTLSDPMDYSLPGSSVHGIFQAKVLEWGAIAFSIFGSKSL